jgi:predicted O-linked N-acetylglucosamine transferase (SPINDLY family)
MFQAIARRFRRGASQAVEPKVAPGDLLPVAFSHHQQGRLDQAESLYRRVLAIDPGHADGLHLLGIAQHQGGRNGPAARLVAWSIAVNGGFAAIHGNLGNILLADGRADAAFAAYRKSVAVDPALPMLCYNLGNALQQLGWSIKAEVAYRRAVAMDPGHAEAQDGLGLALRLLNRLPDSALCHRRAVALAPGLAPAQFNLANVLVLAGDSVGAEAHYRRALLIDPADDEAFGQLVHRRQINCDWRRAGEDRDALLRRARAAKAGISPFILFALASSPTDQLQVARNWANAKTVGVTPIAAHRERIGDKLRIGYLSGDLHNHPVAQMAVELFECHDRDRFEISGFSFGPDDASPLRRRIAGAFDRFADIAHLPDEAAARVINDAGIDILLDLSGHTERSRPRLLAARPAPVQASFLGYPGTTGAGHIDYIVADRVVLPFDQQPNFSEKIVHLPDCFLPNDRTKSVAATVPDRVACGLPATGFAFCCFNNSYKIGPDQFDLWMRLLRFVPDSVLWLRVDNAAAIANLRREATARGVGADRLVFAPRVSYADHLARHRAADLFLDTLPYNAHSTASDALWAGLPVLTCAGRTFAGRVAASLLTAAGLSELVTTSPAEYEAVALRLATAPAELVALHQRLAAGRLAGPLFDTPRLARHLERAFDMMWQCRQHGRPPQPFAVPSDGGRAESAGLS